MSYDDLVDDYREETHHLEACHETTESGEKYPPFGEGPESVGKEQLSVESGARKVKGIVVDLLEQNLR